jgi:hypothetical protein
MPTQRDAHQHRHARDEVLVGHGAQADDDDLGGQDEIGAHRALDLVLLELLHVDLRIGDRFDQLLVVDRLLVPAVQEAVGELLEAFEAEEGAAQHQQRRHRPRRDGADGQRGRHQDRLVQERALGHGPHHRQLAVRIDAGDLLRVQRQVVAEHPRRLLGSDFRED